MTKRLLYGCIYLLCFLSASFLSCKKSVDSTPAIPGNAFPIPAAEPVSGNVSGRIVDENDAPVSLAIIECGGQTTGTNTDGFFTIKNAALDKYISTLTATKTGYFKGYRSFSANAATNYVSIKLVPRILSGTIEAVSGGGITLSNSTALNFQQNSIVVKSTGAAYSGTVNVYASYIDPTAADISVKVPGSFMGRDANNLYILQSTGMLAVEIESTAGEPLQLAANKPATIKLPIPASLVSSAPNTIDTWSLDDKGVWAKESTAAKTGDHYEFLAEHFSFWNCDVPTNAIYLSLHVESVGSSLAGTPVSLRVINYSGSLPFSSLTYGITDNNGNVSGMVPAGFEMRLDLLSTNYLCNVTMSMYTQNIGPFSANASQTIIATLTQQALDSMLVVSGTALDCTGQPLQNGNALIWSGSYFSNANVINGSYTCTIIHCDPVSSVHVYITDNNSNSEAPAVTVPVINNAATVPPITLYCSATFNIYDGIYEVTGTFSDVSNATFIGSYPKHYALITHGLFGVTVADSINGSLDPGYLFNTATGGSYYGNFGIQVSFDPATNLMAEMHNYYGDPSNPTTAIGTPSAGTGAPDYAASNTRRAVLDPSGFNDFNPLTRVIRAKYFMLQPSVVPSGPRCYIDETWTYIGPR